MPFPSRRAARRSLIAVAVVAFASWVVPAWAATTLTVMLPNGKQSTVDLAAIAENPEVNTDYDVRYRKDGPVKKVEVAGGYALEQVLEAAGASDGFEELEIVHDDGVIALDENQVRDVPPPAFYVVNDDVRFIRNSFGPKDVNGHHMVTVSDGTLNVQLLRKSRFRVVVDVKKKAEAGEELTMTARQIGGGAGKQYDYEWNFGDGDTARGKKVEHSFAEEGKYDVEVTASTHRGVEGVGTATVAVGEPKASDESQLGGGTNTAGGAPTSGTYDGSSGAGSPYGSTATPSPPTPPATSTDDPFYDSTTDDLTAMPGDTVEGALLANLGTTPDAAASAARAARTGTPNFEEPDDGDGPAPAALAGIGALALMGAGAGLESGRRPRLRRPRLRLPFPRR